MKIKVMIAIGLLAVAANLRGAERGANPDDVGEQDFMLVAVDGADGEKQWFSRRKMETVARDYLSRHADAKVTNKKDVTIWVYTDGSPTLAHVMFSGEKFSDPVILVSISRDGKAVAHEQASQVDDPAGRASRKLLRPLKEPIKEK